MLLFNTRIWLLVLLWGALTVLLWLLPKVASAQSCGASDLGGIVFRDYDADGDQDSHEPGVASVTIQAFDTSNSVASSTTSGTDGTYVLTGLNSGVKYRLELSGEASYLYQGVASTSTASSKSSVVFATANGACTINFALNNPAQYCQADPYTSAPHYVNGDPLLSGSSGSADALAAFLFSESGESGDAGYNSPLQLAINSEIGPTWGIVYQRSSSSIFVSALMKRHAGFGPLGTGGLYHIDVTDIQNPIVTSWLDLASLGIDTGVDPRTTSGDPGLPANVGIQSTDPNAYSAVGKIGLGGMALSEDEKYLYVISLADRKLNKIFIDLPATLPTVSDVTSFTIPDPGCSGDDFRPWAVAIHDGQVYVGVTCTAEASQISSELQIFVLRLDGTTFTTLFNAALNYTKGYGIHPAFTPLPGGADEWKPWARTFADVTGVTSGGAFVVYPQPILSAISFDSDNAMILALMDRSGHQLGRNNLAAPPSTSLVVNPPSAGDLLRACSIGSNVWELESNGACTGSGPSAGASNSQGPGGGEFYFEDNILVPTTIIDAHQELTIGGLALHYGQGEIISTVFDPFVYESGGTITFNNITGARTQGYEVVQPTEPGGYGKAAGLGDIEILCEPAPIQIGNRIWFDSDKDGVQDSSELGIGSVTVKLYNCSNDTLVASTTTDTNGNYYFDTSAGLTVGTNYCIRLNNAADYVVGGPLYGYTATSSNQGSKDSIDSDADLNAGFPQVQFITGIAGQNDHTFDFGFVAIEYVLSDILSTNIALDGSAHALAKLAQLGVKLRKKRHILRQCGGLSNSKAAAKLALIDSLYLGIWQNAWSFGTTHYELTSSATSATCVETDITATLASLNSRTTALYKLARDSARVNCSTSTTYSRAVSLIKKKAKLAYNAITTASASLPNPIVTCNLGD